MCPINHNQHRCLMTVICIQSNPIVLWFDANRTNKLFTHSAKRERVCHGRFDTSLDSQWAEEGNGAIHKGRPQNLRSFWRPLVLKSTQPPLLNFSSMSTFGPTRSILSTDVLYELSQCRQSTSHSPSPFHPHCTLTRASEKSHDPLFGGGRRLWLLVIEARNLSPLSSFPSMFNTRYPYFKYLRALWKAIGDQTKKVPP